MRQMKDWQLAGFIVVIVLAVALFVAFAGRGLGNDRTIQTNNDSSDQQDIGVDEGMCTQGGGVWNECGSACRANPSDVCIELCVSYCECENDGQCSDGFVCSDYVDSVGVCI
jgi:hypothetical protein